MSNRIFESQCNGCGKCARSCEFLASNGSPGSIVAKDSAVKQSYSCMVCGLCTQICPQGLDPASVFLDLRGRAKKPSAHLSGLARHEAVGSSFPFTLYALPENCDTVFFPGCGLAGTRPETAEACFLALEKHLPNLGVVLDCCIRPSHDMGQREVFGRRFGTLHQRFAKLGIKRVLTACPGCQATLEMNPDISATTVYEFFAERGGLKPECLQGEAVLHDPCVTRSRSSLHEAVRLLFGGTGTRVSELKNNRAKTLCCGKGGGVGNFEQAQKIMQQAQGLNLFTYCSGCAEALSAAHLLDHILRPKGGKPFQVYGYPRAYAQRLVLKSRLKHLVRI